MIELGTMAGWTIGAMVAASCALLLVCLALKLDEWDIRPLRTLAGLAKRPWFEILLLMFMVGGLVQYAAGERLSVIDLTQYERMPFNEEVVR